LKKASEDWRRKSPGWDGAARNAKYLIHLPDIRFDPRLASRERMAEIAQIFYSTTAPKKKKTGRQSGPEPMSSILPRVMAGVIRLKQERTN